MKLSFYIHRTDASPENVHIYKSLNKLVDSGKSIDTNLFFNDVGYNPIPPKFGMFNGSNIWNYDGILVCTTVQNVATALRAVNKFKTVFLYDKEQSKDIWHVLDIASKVPVVVMDEDNRQEYYRLTGILPRVIENFEDFGSI